MNGSEPTTVKRVGSPAVGVVGSSVRALDSFVPSSSASNLIVP
jgi:hypothetical protein